MQDVEIVTKRLILRHIQEKDAPALLNIMEKPEVSENTLIPTYCTLEIVQKWIKDLKNKQEAGLGLALAIQKEKIIIGVINITINHYESFGKLNYWLDSSEWSKGYCTETVRAVTNYCFEILGLNEVSAECLSENLASKKVLSKLNFQYINTEKRYINKYETERSIEIYKLIK